MYGLMNGRVLGIVLGIVLSGIVLSGEELPVTNATRRPGTYRGRRRGRRRVPHHVY